MTRKRFTEREVIQTLLLQGAVIPCGKCRVQIGFDDLKKVERDHKWKIAMGGPDTPENCAYLHGPCHAEKTDGLPATTYGSDKHETAKVNRIAKGGKKRKGRQIPSRPFQKKKEPVSGSS